MIGSLRQLLAGNGFVPAAGVLHLLPPAVGGSVLYLFTNTPQLTTGQQLNTYRQLESNSPLFNLIMQANCNLVLYRTMFTRPPRASNPSGAPVAPGICAADGH